ncbi:MAG: aspartate kinase [Planctomycetaceae bacterium]|nr:aspartate kinase [Planctomycetaceae bacterium]
MPLVVQKFGGTSVADSQKILAAARKAVRAHQTGNQVVMVVSAMGKNTDTLIGLAQEVNERPPAREMDMLLSTGEQVSVALMAMAIDSLGYKAVSLTGAQIGIKTDSSHTKARIHSISTDRIKTLLNEGNIVIAAGFQGIDDNLNITTLGRGGSDTTAVALSAVLGAEQCEIYTDVDGVYTTDPRVLPEACLVRQVCYDEMLELASLGAGVLHSRSVEFGKKFNVPIHVRSSLSDVPGSIIVDDSETAALAVSGAALTKDEALISVFDVPDVPGTIFQIFAPIADKKITVDMIVQNVAENGNTAVSFTVPRNEVRDAIDAIQPSVEKMGGRIGLVDENVSKVSVVGLGMAEQTGVANRMFQTLANAEVNMEIITTSEIKISALVKREQALNALRTVHSEFALDKVESKEPTQLPSRDTSNQVNVAEVIERLQRDTGMESLMIDDISLDDSQSRITLSKVPNAPGIAAQLFDRIAAAGVFVDMIVQSYASSQIADITFTMPREQFDNAITVANQVCEDFGCDKVDFKKTIAKLSVSGVGLRSHTGVAIGMFRALSDANINIETMNTSEVRVNVIVDGDSGQTGIQCLRDAFRHSLR